MCRTHLKRWIRIQVRRLVVVLASPVLLCALTSSRRVSNRGGDRTPRNGPPNSFTGEQPRQPHSGDCALTVDDVVRSSMIVAILCFTFCKIAIALLLRRALPSNDVSSGVRTALPALCPLQAAVVIPLTVSPASVRRTSTTRLTVLLELSTSLPYIHLGYLANERSRQHCSLETIAFTAVDADRRSGERELDTPPFILSLGRTSRRRSPRRPRGFLLLDSEEMDVRAACCPITNSIHLLIIPLLLLCLE